MPERGVIGRRVRSCFPAAPCFAVKGVEVAPVELTAGVWEIAAVPGIVTKGTVPLRALEVWASAWRMLDVLVMVANGAGCTGAVDSKAAGLGAVA